MHNKNRVTWSFLLLSIGSPCVIFSQDITTEIIPGTDISFTLVHLPGGTFLMGSPEDEAGRNADEGPQRVVMVESFWMATHEVTYDEFAIFRYLNRDNTATGTEGDIFDPAIVARPSPPYEDPAHGMGNQGFPVVGITQWAALHYARWLSEKTGHFYRLPTEAEWEYACRAGTMTAYSFGDDPAEHLDSVAWYYGNSNEVFHPVGKKKPNPWELYDIHGNVAEWTLDEYDPEALAKLTQDSLYNPWTQPTRLHPRTVRGGAYDDDPEALRCAARQESSLRWKRRDPQIPKSMWWNTDSPFVGFRLVRPVNVPSEKDQEIFWSMVLGE